MSLWVCRRCGIIFDDVNKFKGHRNDSCKIDPSLRREELPKDEIIICPIDDSPKVQNLPVMSNQIDELKDIINQLTKRIECLESKTDEIPIFSYHTPEGERIKSINSSVKDYLSPELYKKMIINDKKDCVLALIENLHRNRENPRLMNIKVWGGKLFIFDGKKWIKYNEYYLHKIIVKYAILMHNFIISDDTFGVSRNIMEVVKKQSQGETSINMIEDLLDRFMVVMKS